MPLFGTDGVRGLANGPLTADLALTLAQATAVVLGQGRTAEARKAAGKRLTAVVARDPRVSGEFLAAAVEAGLASSGVDVLDAGVLPTPAAAYPDRRHRMPTSASWSRHPTIRLPTTASRSSPAAESSSPTWSSSASSRR